MAYHVRKSLFCFFVLLFTFLLTMLYEAHGTSTVTPNTRPPFDKRSFPDGFVFGAGTAAYQVEGAANIGGKGPSIWDTFTHAHPEKIWDHSTGDVSIDFYDRYKTDIAMVKEIGLGAFRFSISWSRILPNGKISGGVNKEGVNFYNNVINEVLANGIEPFVTIFHWDVPQALDDEFGGFLSAKIVNYYRDYADLCFKLFGDRVKHWTTLNEPLTFSMNGYVTGTMAPGRCSNFIGNCTKGNSGTEPYIVGHHLLLSHATAVQLYKTKYQKVQKGEIGITLVTHWFMPKSNSTVDLRASHRMLDFFFGWFLHPIVYGDYPSTMKSYVKSRLPTFSEKQSKMLKGSMDFLGVNYYTSNYASPALSANKVNLSYTTDWRVALSTAIDGIPICPPTALNWLFICPSGIHSLMLYIKEKYNNPPIYITENGFADANNSTLPLKEALEDEARIKYFEGHLWYLHKAIQDGVNVKGYFAWSIFDSFEWDAGYTVRFGLNFVDYKDGLKRYTKKSATWFKNFLQKH